MLDHNNLEAFSDPVNYDLEDPSDTGVAFYSALAQEAGGSVLEIACGTGRVTIPIAKLGLPTTGLDIVPGMLERARSKSAGLPIRWVKLTLARLTSTSNSASFLSPVMLFRPL